MFWWGTEQPQNISSIHLSLIDTVAMNLGVFKTAAEYGKSVDAFRWGQSSRRTEHAHFSLRF